MFEFIMLLGYERQPNSNITVTVGVLIDAKVMVHHHFVIDYRWRGTCRWVSLGLFNHVLDADINIFHLLAALCGCVGICWRYRCYGVDLPLKINAGNWVILFLLSEPRGRLSESVKLVFAYLIVRVLDPPRQILHQLASQRQWVVIYSSQIFYSNRGQRSCSLWEIPHWIAVREHTLCCESISIWSRWGFNSLQAGWCRAKLFFSLLLWAHN